MGSISTTPYVCQASRLPRMQFSIQCLCQQNCWPWSNVVWSLLSYCLQKWQKILYYHISINQSISIMAYLLCRRSPLYTVKNLMPSILSYITIKFHTNKWTISLSASTQIINCFVILTLTTPSSPPRDTYIGWKTNRAVRFGEQVWAYTLEHESTRAKLECISPRQVHYTKCTITKCTISTCEKALKDAEVTKYDIEDVLSGGWDNVDAQSAGDCVATLSSDTQQVWAAMHTERSLKLVVMSQTFFSWMSHPSPWA